MISYILICIGWKARNHRENVPKIVFQTIGSKYCQRHFVMYLLDTFPCRLCCFCCNDFHFWETCKGMIWIPGSIEVLCFSQYIGRFTSLFVVVCQGVVFDSNIITKMFQND